MPAHKKVPVVGYKSINLGSYTTTTGRRTERVSAEAMIDRLRKLIPDLRAYKPPDLAPEQWPEVRGGGGGVREGVPQHACAPLPTPHPALPRHHLCGRAERGLVC